MGGVMSRLAAIRRVGADRHLRRAMFGFLGFSIAEFGTWVTVLVYAYRVGDATTVGVVAVAQLVPAAILAPVLASRLERLSRSLAAAVAYAAQALALGATAASMALEAPPVVTFAFAVLANVSVSMGRPAHNSLVPELVGDPAQLTAANVVTTSVENMGIFAGPALAGLVMSIGGPPAALATLVVGLVLGAASVWSLPRVTRPPLDRAAGDQRSTGQLRAVAPFLVIGGAQQTVIGALDVLIVLLAIEELGVGESGAGYLNAALGLGGVVGGLLATSMVGRGKLTPTLLAGTVVRAGSLFLIGFVPAAALFLAGTGVGYSVIDVANRTLLQRTVPVERMATVFGFLESTSMAALTLGSILAPLLVSSVGTSQAFAVMGIAMPVLLALVWRPLRRAEESAVVASEALNVILGADLFSGLEPAIQEALARSSTLESADAGRPVVVEGDVGDRMWVIADGEVEVSKDGHMVATLGPGDVFGEIALLSNRPRIATVTPTCPTRLLALDRHGFFAALATDPITHAAFEEMARLRIRETLGE